MPSRASRSQDQWENMNKSMYQIACVYSRAMPQGHTCDAVMTEGIGQQQRGLNCKN